MDGYPCIHSWERFRGFAICVNANCGVITHWDGTLLSRREVQVLINQLTYEQGPDWDKELTA